MAHGRSRLSRCVPHVRRSMPVHGRVLIVEVVLRHPPLRPLPVLFLVLPGERRERPFSRLHHEQDDAERRDRDDEAAKDRPSLGDLLASPHDVQAHAPPLSPRPQPRGGTLTVSSPRRSESPPSLGNNNCLKVRVSEATISRGGRSQATRAIDAVRFNTRPIDPREAIWGAPPDEPRTQTHPQTTRATRGI